LSGTPNADTTLSHNFDHRFVCDDVEQSELSFNTGLTGTKPLDQKLENKLCRGDVLSYFQDKSEPDANEASKNLQEHQQTGRNLSLLLPCHEGRAAGACLCLAQDAVDTWMIRMSFDHATNSKLPRARRYPLWDLLGGVGECRLMSSSGNDDFSPAENIGE
jgi:hypothetical protein